MLQHKSFVLPPPFCGSVLWFVWPLSRGWWVYIAPSLVWPVSSFLQPALQSQGGTSRRAPTNGLSTTEGWSTLKVGSLHGRAPSSLHVCASSVLNWLEVVVYLFIMRRSFNTFNNYPSPGPDFSPSFCLLLVLGALPPYVYVGFSQLLREQLDIEASFSCLFLLDFFCF